MTAARRGRLATALLVVGAVAAPRAVAAPSVWDVARDPGLAEAHRLLVAAERARSPRDIPLEAAPAFGGLLSLRAATLIELGGGRALPGTDLKLFLGDALVSSDSGRDAEGRALLEAALAEDPETPLAAQALFTIAIASNRLGELDAEHTAYTRALEVEWDREHRSQIHMNRGECSMSMGRLRAARRDYRIALALTQRSEIFALSSWGLGVALARDNELPQALERVRAAAAVQFRGLDGKVIQAIDLHSVFFTPDYEIHYYRALAHMAAAARAERPEAAASVLARAIEEWEHYLEGARRRGDRWLANAEQHRAWCRRRLEAARAAAR